MILEIKKLSAVIEEKEIIKSLSLELEKGKVHAIMGPNGSGKSTLANIIMGNPVYEVKKGEILFEGGDILESSTDERARNGIFMAFQYPREIAGVTFLEFLRAAYVSVNKARDKNFKAPSVFEFKKLVKEKMKLLKLEADFLERSVNQGFSGGEKKKCEMLQLVLLQPKLAILDETDSGLDVDALSIVGKTLKVLKEDNPDMTILLITHYQRILDHIQPDFVHVMVDGKIAKSGKKDLAIELEKEGYEKYSSEKAQSSGLNIL